jgi:hypothetical protein
MQTVTNKSGIGRPPSKPAAEVDVCHATIGVVDGAVYTMAVMVVIGRLLGLVAVG